MPVMGKSRGPSSRIRTPAGCRRYRGVGVAPERAGKERASAPAAPALRRPENAASSPFNTAWNLTTQVKGSATCGGRQEAASPRATARRATRDSCHWTSAWARVRCSRQMHTM